MLKMSYIKTAIGEIDMEELEEILNSRAVTIGEVVKTWEKYEDMYDYWATVYGLNLITKWIDDKNGDVDDIDCMAYGIEEFVNWVNTLN
jgi:hypothetical protein